MMNLLVMLNCVLLSEFYFNRFLPINKSLGSICNGVYIFPALQEEICKRRLKPS